MSIEPGHWKQLKTLAGGVFRSSLHFTIATANPDGSPHLTPIGSLILGDPGEAYFFEIFARQLARNLDAGSSVAVLGVNSSSRLWLRALVAGRFRQPPAFRLLGSAGERRPATSAEKARWQRKVRFLRWTRGYDRLWGNLDVVRELHLHRLQPVRLGPMSPRFDWAQIVDSGDSDRPPPEPSDQGNPMGGSNVRVSFSRSTGRPSANGPPSSPGR